MAHPYDYVENIACLKA